MDYEKLADLLYPNITKTIKDWEVVYPKRNLPPGAAVTRFAPSPTGFIHIGGIYMALTEERIAHQSNGVYILRIEDTDKEREKDNGVNDIIDALHIFGIDADEGAQKNGEEKGNHGPYLQSKRLHIYHSFAKQLVAMGHAYPSFASSEELEAIRKEQESQKAKPGYYGTWAKDRTLTYEEIKAKIKKGESFVIRLKSSAKEDPRIFHDEIKGNISVPHNDQDSVLLKSDGFPTYHFGHVVDDYLMKTTHVIRGDEWLSSLPLHLELFEAFGFPAPKFAHLAPIMKVDGTRRKLSKRKDPEAAVSYYIEHGYPPLAVIEYVLNLLNSSFEDWRKENPGKNYKEFPVKLDKMPPSGALFDLNKLESISREIIGAMTTDELFTNIQNWSQIYDKELYDKCMTQEEKIRAILNIERGGDMARKDYAKYEDIKPGISFFFAEEFDAETHNGIIFPEHISKDQVKTIIDTYGAKDIHAENKDEWFDHIKALAVELGYAPDPKTYKANKDAYRGHVGDVAMVLRLAITGRSRTPDLFAVMEILGKEEIKRRLLNITA